MQTAVYTPTGTGTAFTSIQAPITISAMGFVDTNTYGFEFDYFVQMMDGSPVSPAATLSARFEVTKTANGKITCLATQRTSGDFISVSEGHIALPLVKINDVAANLTAPALYLSYSPSAAYSIPSKPYKMGVGGVRIVKVS
jgi:hypothetical protein